MLIADYIIAIKMSRIIFKLFLIGFYYHKEEGNEVYNSLRKVHQQGCTEPARDALIHKIGQEKFAALKQDAFTTRKITQQLLEDTKTKLEREQT